MTPVTESQLALYQSLFCGRADVYARRWEKGDKSGYAPAYQFDWGEFMAHKARGGTMADFANKALLSLTPDVIRKHLIGQHVIGVYPLLSDNTSHFIAADFDGTKALDEARALRQSCAHLGLPTYLERSRSGNGVHVWMFFAEAYPASRSRRIMLECVRRALGLSAFDKEVAFDRLFPNQDLQSGKGFGNLIALPLQGVSAARGNTTFIDAGTAQPFSDQWEFLAGVERVSRATLDAALSQVSGATAVIGQRETSSSKLTLRLNNGIRLQKSLLDKETVSFLKEELNLPNLDYWLKKRLGKSVYQTEKFFRLIEEDGDEVVLPRGFLPKLQSYLASREIAFSVKDERAVLPEVSYSSSIKLRPEQTEAVDAAMAAGQGVIVAPPGSGKTVMGLELVARHAQPALILTHRKQIMDQWVERAQAFLGLPKAKIGRLGGAKNVIGDKLTIAMMQSLARKDDLTDLSSRFGLVIIDECHHVPAKTFRKVATAFNARYCYGLTATPKRKHDDEKLIYLFIGDIVATLPDSMIAAEGSVPRHEEQPERHVVIRETELAIPFSITADKFELLARLISFDQSRNRLVLQDIKQSVEAGHKTLVLSERKEHLEVLNLCLKGTCETILITGDDSAASRKRKFAQIKSGHYQAVLATGQLVGEGMDIPDIHTVILAFPLGFEGKLTQYIGRIRRAQKTVYDYHDAKTPFLDRQFKKRKKFYDKYGFKMTNV